MATAIVAGLASAIVAALKVIQQSWQISDAYMTTSSELRRGIDAMSRELASTQSAQLVGLPADGNWYTSLIFAVPADVDGDGTVLNSGGNLEWSSAITYSRGGTTGTQALRTQAGNLNRVMANGVTTLRFRRQVVTPNIVEINMTVLRGTSTTDYPNQASLSGRVRLRN